MEIGNSQWKSLFKEHLDGGSAFVSVEKILGEIEFNNLEIRPAGLPYSFFEIFYHMWFTQKDILEYCKNQDYIAPSWPDDYWSNRKGPLHEEEWKHLKENFFSDRKEILNLRRAKNDIFERVPSGNDHSYFREIMLVIEHNAYHSGQLLIILRLLGQHS